MNPRSTLLIAIVTLILILGMGAGIVYTLFFTPKETASSSSDYFSNLLPFSNSKEGNATLPSSQGTQTDIKTTGTIPVRTLGGMMETRDFTKDTDVTITTEGDAFLLAFPKEFEFSDTGLQYEISYIPEEQRIYLSILKEPIGDIRRTASNDLTQRLNISSKELCVLDVLVVAPRWVNDYYADKNLGFPGCPGAVKFQGDPTF